MLQFTILFILLFRFNSSIVTFTRAFDFIILFLLLILIAIQSRYKKITKGAIYWVVAVIASMLVTYLMSAVNRGSIMTRDLFEIFRPILYFSVYMFFRHYSNNITNRKITNLFCIYVFFQLALMLTQKMFPNIMSNSFITLFYSMDKVSEGLGRVTGMSGNPNTLAICLTIIFYYLFYNVSKDSYRLLVAIIHIATVFFTTSRAVTLIVLFIYTFYFIISVPLKYKVLLSSIIAMSLGTLFSFLLDNPYFNEVITHAVNLEFTSIPSVYNRLEHYRILLDGFLSSPLFGVGPNKNITNVGDNIYLFILYQWGVIGLLIQLFPVFYFFIKAIRVKSPESSFFISISIVLFMGGFVYETYYNLIYIPIFVFFCSRINNSHRHGNENTSYS